MSGVVKYIYCAYALDITEEEEVTIFVVDDTLVTMSEFEDDEIRVLPDRQSDPAPRLPPSNPKRSTHLFVGRSRRGKNTHNNEAYVDDTEKNAKKSTYGYLEHILTYRDSCTPNDKSLKKSVR